MIKMWFSPLAPTVLFLVGAFVVRRIVHKVPFSLFISLLVFGLLVSRIVFRGQIAWLSSLLVLSGWEPGGALTIRIDGLSMAFLCIPVFLLIGVFWARQAVHPDLLLGLAGAAELVWVAANGISFSYALLFFDVVGCIFWLRYARPNLALARLFLALLTTSSLMLAGLGEMTELAGHLLAFSLWLRVGLLPFVELSYLSENQLRSGDLMVWLALSTAVGVYVAARFLAVPLPQLMTGLMVLIVLLNAWLAWLADDRHIRLKLLRMVLIQPSLALLIAPAAADVSIALGLVYTFGLGTLWLTPQMGLPNVLERHWSWVYTAPVLATLSLMSFPATFGWLATDRIYAALLANGQLAVVAAVLLAESLALSILVHYWRWLLAGTQEKGRELSAALVLAVPFLIPWVGGQTFSVVTNLDLQSTNLAAFQATWAVMGVVWLLALGLGFGRRALLTRLKLLPQAIRPVLDLSWLWGYVGQAGDQISRVVLRIKSILEGVHYLGWAFLIGLAGILMVILS